MKQNKKYWVVQYRCDDLFYTKNYAKHFDLEKAV